MFRILNYFRNTQPEHAAREIDQRKDWKEIPFIEVLRMDEEDYEQYVKDRHKHFVEKEDFLGFAAKAKHEALAAVKERRYDDAWRWFHEQKLNYMKHAAREKFNRFEILALDGDISEGLANVLRLEGKHADALTHIVYWVASSSRKLKRHDSKLEAYFKRAKLVKAEFGDVAQFIQQMKDNPEFPIIHDQIRRWR